LSISTNKGTSLWNLSCHGTRLIRLLFSPRSVDRRRCCQLSSIIAGLSHRASTVVYNTFIGSPVGDSLGFLIHVYTAWMAVLCSSQQHQGTECWSWHERLSVKLHLTGKK